MAVDVERSCAVHRGEIARDDVPRYRIGIDAAGAERRAGCSEHREQRVSRIQCRISHQDMRCFPRPRSSTESTLPLESDVSLFVPPVPPPGSSVGVEA